MKKVDSTKSGRKVNMARETSATHIVFSQFCRNRMAVLGAIILLVMVLIAILAPVINPYNYAKVDPINADLGPSVEHWFGTDSFGRDIFSRITYGARYSLSIGIIASIFGCILGIVFGLIAGYFTGIVETCIMRFCDILQSIPNMLLCIIISVSLGSGVFPTIIALAVGSIPIVARLLRATMLSVRETEYIEAAQAINCSKARIMVRHILPNCFAPIIVTFTTSTGRKITSLASLSFLGLGIKEPLPEWGAMINTARDSFRYHPHEVIFPGLCIVLLVLSLNMIGDGLRDALDPKLKN